MCPAAIFARKFGTVKGDSRLGPRPSVVLTASTIVPNPPTPEPANVAVLSRASSESGCHRAWVRASCAAQRASILNRSIFFWSLGSATRAASNPLGQSGVQLGTTPATLDGIPSITASGSAMIPECPCTRWRHTASTPHPRGDTTPIPVTTTRLLAIAVPFPYNLPRCD